MEFMDIGTEQQLILCLHSKKTNTDFRMDIKIVKYLDPTTAVIQLLMKGSSPVNFEGTTVHLECKTSQSAPYFWNHSKVVWYKGNYILRVPHSKGVKINRRGSYRVSIGAFARTNHESLPSVTVRDISHSGFALSSSQKEVVMKVGDTISATLSDQGFTIRLKGRLVRIEKREDVIIYGFYFIAPCVNLDEYIALKQRPLRGKK